ncbi:uncharacterized protein NPIL_619821 [Nephila pilipes]|uniref:Uncharacterized protein n=1 Tax=Nephila pilipes TaxID=299642 RepID=A0A8X6NKA5_NEPPI|nr:uncharacterized protein NPIL_619821 [Nephila pilipes]
MESKVLENAIQNFENSLNDESIRYRTPDILRDICKISVIHEKTKSLNFKNIPDRLVFLNVIDDYENSIKAIEGIIKIDTKECFKELDNETKSRMKHGGFRCLILATLYLEGKWYAYSQKLWYEKEFYNADGSVTKNANFFYFEDLKVVIENNTLTVDVPYNNNLENFARFTMPYVGQSRTLKKTRVCLPEVDVSFRKELKTNPKSIIDYRYQHNVNGFTKACFYSMGTYDSVRKLKKFYFDKPFDITVFYKNAELLKVHIDNVKPK